MFQSTHRKFLLVFSVLLLSTLACALGASHLEKAREAVADGETETAFEEYKLALEEDDLPAEDRFAVLSERGDLYRNQENVEAALADYEAALNVTNAEGNPVGDRTSVYNRRVDIYVLQEQWPEVIADLDAILASQPDNYEALARRGYAHLQLRNFEQAIDDLKASLQGDIDAATDDLDNRRNLINAYYDLAQALLDVGEYDASIENYTEALNLADDTDDRVEILVARGFAYSEMYENEKALTDLNEAIGLDANEPLAYAYRSYVYGDQEKYEDAIADATKAIELGSDLSDARRGTIVHARAVAYLSTGQYEEAIVDATESIELAGVDVESTARTYNVRGQAYRYMGDYENAIADYTQAIEYGTTDVTALDNFYRNRAYSNYLNYSNKDALADIEAAISLNIEEPAAYDYDLIGRIEYEEGNYEAAIANYEQALALVTENDPWIHNRLGDTYYELSAWDQAETQYRTAIELAPEEPLFVENLGFTLNLAGRPEEALDTLFQAADLGSDNPWVYNEIGDIYYNFDDLANAELAYQSAIEVNPEVALFHENLALSLRLLERFEESIPSYDTALSLDPERPYSYFGRGISHYALSQDAQAIPDLETALTYEISDDLRTFIEERLAEMQ